MGCEGNVDMANYVTMRRWGLKPGHTEDELLEFVNTGIVPAWREIAGCLSLNFLRVHNANAYLAVTYWDSKDASDRWAGAEGQAWREQHRDVLERWLELMAFQDELETDLLVVG
jgi:heme-degrading monooxygenase HmoA